MGSSSLVRLQQILGVGFRDVRLLTQALTHGSATPGRVLADNDRLEFLGDGVLGLIAKEHVYRCFPEDAGHLTVRIVALTRNDTLAKVFSNLDLKRFVIIGRGGYGVTQRMKADILEAIIGAIYLDQGLEAAREFVHRVIIEPHRELVDTADYSAGVTRNRRHFALQARLHGNVTYIKVSSEKGKVVDVYGDGQFLARGEGRTYPEAKDDAVTKAFAVLEQAEQS